MKGDNLYNHFSKKEAEGVDQMLMIALDQARAFAGIPFILTSTLRTKEENARVGGVENSSHLKGLAVDIACKDNAQRFKIVEACLKYNITRFGFGRDFIHIDIDQTKAQRRMWIEISV